MHTELAVAAVVIIALAILHRRDARLKKKERASFFDACLGLFSSYRIVQDGSSYPVLTGAYHGYDIRLEPVADNMAWRRVPILWLKVTVLKSIPYAGALDLLVRPGAVEMCSPSHELDYHLELPEGWPEPALLCTDDPAATPPLEDLTPHMHIFADAKMKELVITPHGVRLLYLTAQASRLHYAVLRELRFDNATLDAERAKTLLEAAIGIADAVSGRASFEVAA